MPIYDLHAAKLQKARNAIEALYDCDVEKYTMTSVKDPVTKQTSNSWALSGVTFRGKLIHVANYTSKEEEAVDTLSQISKLMCSPDVDIPTGARFKIVHTIMNSKTETLYFQGSGLPLKYNTNQVIPVRATQQFV